MSKYAHLPERLVSKWMSDEAEIIALLSDGRPWTVVNVQQALPHVTHDSIRFSLWNLVHEGTLRITEDWHVVATP